MLVSTYLTLIVISFLCFILSLIIGNKESSKLISKLILMGIAMGLFGGLALQSTDVDVVYCTSASCTTQAFFFQAEAYIFGALTIFSGALTLFYAFLMILEIWKQPMEYKDLPT